MYEKKEGIGANSVCSGQSTLEKARVYDKTRFSRRPKMRRLDRFEKKFARDLLNLAGTDSCVVDIPCGNGRFFDIFSAARELIMIDYSTNMLQALEEKYGKGNNIRLIQADIGELPLPDNSVDLCFCMRLFHHMKNDQVMLGALKELSRISRKYVAVTFYNKNSLRFYRRKLLGKKIRGSYVTLKHIVGLAKQAGLEPLDSFRLNFIEQQCLELFRKV